MVSNQSGRTPPNWRETLHSVVVTSKDETETAVDAKEGWITVQKVRKAKDRKIIVEFKTNEEQSQIKDIVGKMENNLVVEEVKNKDPLVILRDVLLVNTDDDVLKALRNQNKTIFHGLAEGENRVEVKYRKRVRNPLTGHLSSSAYPRKFGGEQLTLEQCT